MTNHAAFAYADAPLFLFHLLEFSGVDFDIDVAGAQRTLGRAGEHRHLVRSWSSSTPTTKVDIVTHAPPTGIYRMNDDGTVSYDRFDYRPPAHRIASARPSSCASPDPATTATRAPISAS